MHHAAEYGQVDVIKALQEVMDMDLDIDPPDNYGWCVCVFIAPGSGCTCH